MLVQPATLGLGVRLIAALTGEQRAETEHQSAPLHSSHNVYYVKCILDACNRDPCCHAAK